MNVWSKLPVKSDSGGLWDHLAEDLQEPASLQGGLGLWGQLGVQPSGLWSEARDETLILADRVQTSVWEEAKEETLILDRTPRRNVWGAAQEQAKDTSIRDAEQASIWDEIGQETLLISRRDQADWLGLQIRDVTRYKPIRALGWALKELETAKGEQYWVLKNLRQGAYLKLTEQQVYLWNLMDGSHSVQDLAVAMFLKYQVLSVEWLVGFLGQLYSKGFLVTEGVNVYQAMGMQLQRRGLLYWIKRLVTLIFHFEVSFRAVDPFYTALYRLVGWIFFTPPVMLFIWLVSLSGIPVFFYITQHDALSFAGISFQRGLAALLLAETFAVFAHESAHALTTKHYGRTVRRGGVGLYFGMIAFFMDTTDIWMEPRKPRLAVTWAGPLSGFFLGSLASLFVALSPSASWAGLVCQFAIVCYSISVVNLNPLLKLDGYYILMDWLEMPMLRERSISFVRQGFWSKLHNREKFEREDLIYTVFGTLALLWTGFVIFSVLRLFGSKLLDFMQRYVDTKLGWTILTTLVGLFGLVYLIRYIKARWR